MCVLNFPAIGIIAAVENTGKLALGDSLPFDPPKFSETAEGKKKAVSAAAKARRKDRKGERRSRRG